LPQQAVALGNDLARSGEGAAFTLIVLDTHEQPLAGEGFDLTIGRPVDGLLGQKHATDVSLWQGYVHYRVAWECAGDLRRGFQWNERILNVLHFGDDVALERLLNEVATEAFSALSPSLRELMAEYLGTLWKETQDRNRQLRLLDELTTAQLLWKPPGQQASWPTPWAARALLLRGEAGTSRALMRGCLICPYLAHEILNLCFNLEAQERTFHLAGKNVSPLLKNEAQRKVWDEAVTRRQQFRQGDEDSEGVFYPVGCPALPGDEWDFASFGKFLKLLPRDPVRTPLVYEVVFIRNALAHGHYVCWCMIQRLQRAQRQLGW
jgi:hypothetical protein